MVTFIAQFAVETDSILTANKVALKALKKDAVRGSVTVSGQKVRWSTLQQYNYHNGFTRRKK